MTSTPSIEGNLPRIKHSLANALLRTLYGLFHSLYAMVGHRLRLSLPYSLHAWMWTQPVWSVLVRMSKFGSEHYGTLIVP